MAVSRGFVILKLIIFLLPFMMLSTNFSYAALSATTANTMVGRKPALSFDGGITVADNIDELVSFNMPDGTGGEVKIGPTVTSVVAEPDWTLEQFVAQVTADGMAKTISADYYYDADGDEQAAIPVSGNLTATWTYQEQDKPGNWITKKLSASDLSEHFDACLGDYTLTITANNVKALSKYGDPIDNSYGSISQSYTVSVNDYKICFAKPNQMIVKWENTWLDGDSDPSDVYDTWNSGNPNRSSNYGGGYSNDFDPVQGFKASAAIKFPTTGFPKAKFQLVMTHEQNNYTYSSSQPLKVSVDSLGYVTIKGKPSGEVVITATPKNTEYPAVTYAFNIGIWAIPDGSGDKQYSQSLCGGVSNQLKRSEMTNTPYITAQAGMDKGLKWIYSRN